MDVQRGELPGKTRRELVQQMQQHNRVYPAAQADQNSAMCREQRRDERRTRS